MLKNQLDVRVRVQVGDVDEVLVAKHVKLLERVEATLNVYLRAREPYTDSFRLHFDSEIATWQLRDLTNPMAAIEVHKGVIPVVFTRGTP